MGRHVVEMSDEVWEKLLLVAEEGGYMYNGRPSRTAAIVALAMGEQEDVAPSVEVESPVVAVPWEEAWNEAKKWEGGLRHFKTDLKRFYDMVVSNGGS